MAFKMKGHELPGPNQRKSPAKNWVWGGDKYHGAGKHPDKPHEPPTKHTKSRGDHMKNYGKDHTNKDHPNYWKDNEKSSDQMKDVMREGPMPGGLILETPEPDWAKSPAKDQMPMYSGTNAEGNNPRNLSDEGMAKVNASHKAHNRKHSEATAETTGHFAKGGSGAKMKSPAKDTKYFSENTSFDEMDFVTAHNKKHQQGLGPDHKTQTKKKKDRKKASGAKMYGKKSPAKCPLLAAIGPVMDLLGKKKE